MTGGRTDEPASRRGVTLAEVAREAGVSLATASRALNGSDRPVRASSRARIEQAAARLGYRADATAQAMVRGATRTVALVVRDVRARYFGMIAQGVIEAAARSNLVVTITGGEAYEDARLERLRGIRGQQPTAIVLADHRFHDPAVRTGLLDELESYRAGGVGVAVIGADDLPYPSVSFSDDAGASELARTLAAAGYRRPLLIGGAAAVPGVIRRACGFQDGFERAGVSLATGPAGNLTRDGGYRAVLGLSDRTLRETDLMVCVNDVTAFGAAAALRDRGIEVGRQIAVSGFDDIPGAVDVRPALTTVRLPLFDAGVRALSLALDAGAPPPAAAGEPASAADDVTAEPGRRLWLDVRVVVRSSTPLASSS